MFSKRCAPGLQCGRFEAIDRVPEMLPRTETRRRMVIMHGSIQLRNERLAKVWSLGGLAYEEISRQIASPLDRRNRHPRL